MINIIEHFWQFQIKGNQIFPSLLKTQGNSPKIYFYSSKSQRVLRKKQQTTQQAMSILKEGLIRKDFMMISLKQFDKVQFSLILLNEVSQRLDNPLSNCLIVALQLIGDSPLIIQCSIDIHGTVKGRLFMRYLNNFWKSYQEETNLEINQRIYKYMLDLWINLPKYLNITSKCIEIKVILCTDGKFSTIKLIWCNKLLFTKAQFYQINYQYFAKDNSLSTSKIDNPQQDDKLKNKTDQNLIQPSSLNNHLTTSDNPTFLKQTIQQQQKIKCNGCNRSVNQQQCKQVDNEQVINLRRKNKLSIMGILDQYLLVCEECYLDE